MYSLDPAYRGRGLATVAARAVLAHAFNVLGLERVVAGVDAPNVASTRVLGRLGLQPLTEGAAADRSVAYYAITREAFIP